MTKKKKSTPSPEDWALNAKWDPVVAAMIRLKLPLDLETYLDLNWPGRNLRRQPLGPEELAEMPPVLREQAAALS